MAIVLTCTCGQQQPVAPERAGKTITCGNCGKTLTVPAMGVLATPTPKAKPGAPPVAVGSLLPLLLVAGVLLLLLTLSAGWLIWALLQTPRGAPPTVAEKSTHVTPPGKKDVEDDIPVEERISGSVPRDDSKPALPKRVIEPVPARPLLDLPAPLVKPLDPVHPPIAFAKPMMPAPKPSVIEPVGLVWKLREGEVFYQEVTVAQKPTFKVQGLPIAMDLRYQVVSRFTVKKQHKDGGLVVEQKIENAKLIFADELSKPALVPSLLQLPGTTYTIELDRKMDVVKFDGAKDNPQTKNIQLGGGIGMRTSSLIDRDGWKELAQATFFQFDQLPAVNQRWSKPLTHNWGAMGSWKGKIHYLYVGPQKNEHVIRYGLDLAYQKPAAGAATGLMKINGADFKPHLANGMLRFDSVKGRVVHAEEVFHVRGVLNANLLGQNQVVEIDEYQHFVIRIHEKMP